MTTRDPKHREQDWQDLRGKCQHIHIWIKKNLARCMDCGEVAVDAETLRHTERAIRKEHP
jgi:hypothetical protein